MTGCYIFIVETENMLLTEKNIEEYIFNYIINLSN